MEKHDRTAIPIFHPVRNAWNVIDRDKIIHLITGVSDRRIIRLYHAHGECEQFHSEVKTDMDLERLPSGKFATNALILELGMIAYNILRMIGQGTIGGRAPRQKRNVKRRRLRTVISNLIMMAGHVTMHARQLIIGLGKSNVWRHIFSYICQKYAVTNA